MSNEAMRHVCPNCEREVMVKRGERKAYCAYCSNEWTIQKGPKLVRLVRAA